MIRACKAKDSVLAQAAEQISQTGGLPRRHQLLTVPEAGSPRSASAENLAAPSQGGDGGALVSSFSYKGTNPMRGALFSRSDVNLIASRINYSDLPLENYAETRTHCGKIKFNLSMKKEKQLAGSIP